MGESEYNGAIGCVLGGEGSTATGGFWSALNIATTLKLPVLFVIEDNGYAISVPGALQSPGGDVAANLKSFSSLMVLSGNGTDAEETASLLHTAVQAVRQGAGPALVHLKVPRLSGHSGQDTQAYKSEEVVKEEQSRDPLPKLRLALCSRGILSEEEWRALEAEAREAVQGAKERALRLREAEADRKEIARHVFCETQNDGTPDLSVVGGARGEGFPLQTSEFAPEPTRTNMLTAIRRTLQGELRENPRVVVFGEDVGPKGGVHGATLGLQTEFGEARVFDTSLSEEGIIGRAVGMALNGLVPIPEIQFRKYADAATEQLNNCGTIRWRTTNRFAAPRVVRIPIGFLRCGDPWHSVSNEVFWAHAVGWQVALPSNAEDAVGLLRTAIRGHNPVVFLEHRALYDSPWARRPYPGDRFTLPFGEARVTRTGERLTVVTWGAYVERCETAAERVGGSAIEIIDLRTIVPWDRAAVLHSVRKTRRCLVVHEDGITAGFGAEVAAVVAEEAFFSLDAPVSRIGVCDIPIPYNVHLMEATLPSVEEIEAKMTELLEA
jgi:2-oxoisovalerate dehydrogenase E1 component